MELQVGDFLFGYPIVGIAGGKVLVRLPSDITIEYDYALFTANVLAALAEVGAYVPKAG